MILYPYSNATARLLANPPATGQGRHLWLFQTAAGLIHAGIAPAAVQSRLEAIAQARGWTDRIQEIAANCAKIAAGIGEPAPKGRREKITWPLPNEKARRARFSHPPLFAPDPAPGADQQDILRALFPGKETLLCCATSAREYVTLARAELESILPAFQFIVPNPMTSRAGRTAAGYYSARSAANATPPGRRVYAVIEFDTGDALDEQTAVLSSLHSDEAPLVLAVYSGGKSIHGWYDVRALPPAHKRRFFLFAAYLGADASLYDTSKLVRMPLGRRDNGQLQHVLYFEREHIQ